MQKTSIFNDLLKLHPLYLIHLNLNEHNSYCSFFNGATIKASDIFRFYKRWNRNDPNFVKKKCLFWKGDLILLLLRERNKFLKLSQTRAIRLLPIKICFRGRNFFFHVSSSLVFLLPYKNDSEKTFSFNIIITSKIKEKK